MPAGGGVDRHSVCPHLGSRKQSGRGAVAGETLGGVIGLLLGSARRLKGEAMGGRGCWVAAALCSAVSSLMRRPGLALSVKRDPSFIAWVG